MSVSQWLQLLISGSLSPLTMVLASQTVQVPVEQASHLEVGKAEAQFLAKAVSRVLAQQNIQPVPCFSAMDGTEKRTDFEKITA